MECTSGRRSSKGLESLQHLDQVMIKQKKTKANVNTYHVTDKDDQPMFVMLETPFPDPTVIVNSKVRAFHMNVFDMHQNKVFSFHRPRTFGNVADNIQVFLNGSLVSVVREAHKTISWNTRFLISDSHDKPVYRIKGDMKCNNCQIQTVDKTVVGCIKKKFTTVMKELFTNQDNYVIEFPPNCTLESKAAIICSCILIDFKYHDE